MDAIRDIAIVGGGLVGSTLAYALRQAGFDVALVEARYDTGSKEFDGRGYALSHASARMLRTLGVWRALEDTAQPILDVRASDGRVGEGPSALCLHLDHRELEEGPMGWMVEARHLRPALSISLDGVARRVGAGVVSRTTDSVSTLLALSDGSEVRARVVVAADGKRSGMAARAGIERTGWSYGQTALVCAISHELDHGGVAHQFFMPEGPLAILPLKGRRSSIVWSGPGDSARRINGLPDADYLAVLRPRFGDYLGDIALEGRRFSYPLELSLANDLTADRLALVGDAAHAVHPIAGQGLNQGLRDVATLAEILTDARRRGEDFGSAAVLSRYARWRRFDITALAIATDGFNRLFSNDVGPFRAIRRLGMELVSAFPALRRGFMREAAGLTGDLPRLLAGRRL